MIVTAVSATWAWLACVLHLVCVWRLRSSTAPFASTWMWMSAGTAALTFTYASAYTWLLLGNPDRSEWSGMLAYVAFVGWPVVFVLPAVMTLVANQAARGQKFDRR